MFGKNMIVSLLLHWILLQLGYHTIVVYSSSDGDHCTEKYRVCADENEICTRYFGQFLIPDADNLGSTKTLVTKQSYQCRSIDFCTWWGAQDGQCAKYISDIKYSYFSDTLFEGTCFGPAVVTVPTNLTITCCTDDCADVGWYTEQLWSVCGDVSDDVVDILPSAIPEYTRNDEFQEYLACNRSDWQTQCTIPIYRYMVAFSTEICTLTTTLGGDQSYQLLDDLSQILVLTLSDQFNWSSICPWWEFSCSDSGEIQQTFYPLVFDISFADNTTAVEIEMTDAMVDEVESDIIELIDDLWPLQMDVQIDSDTAEQISVTINCFTEEQQTSVTELINTALSALYTIIWGENTGPTVDVIVPTTTDANGNDAPSLMTHNVLTIFCLVTFTTAFLFI